MVTTIWSLIVSLYGLGAFFGSLSINFVSCMLGRWVKNAQTHSKLWVFRSKQAGVVSVVRKMAAICNACLSIAAGGIMLASKPVESYEMIIVSRILYGFSAGEILWCVRRYRFCAWLIGPPTSSSGLGQGLHLMYLAEISPKNIRGAVCQSAATFLCLGKLLGQIFGLRWDVKVGSRSSTSAYSCPHLMERVFLLFLPVRSSGEKICGTSSSAFLHSSLWFRFWCCLFFQTLPDICSLRKAMKMPAKEVCHDVCWYSDAALLEAKCVAPKAKDGLCSKRQSNNRTHSNL